MEAANHPVAKLSQFHVEFANFHEAYISRYIALADSKAAVILGVMSGLLAYLFGKQSIAEAVVKFDGSKRSFVAVGTVILLSGSGFGGFKVIAPRFFTSVDRGLVFFKSVALFPNAEEFVRKIGALDESSLAEAWLVQCYDLSRVCASKYRFLRISLWLGLFGVLGVIYTLIAFAAP